MLSEWFKLSSNLMQANFEAQRVVGLRLAKLAKGGTAAQAEAQRMVTEKWEAAAEAAMSFASGKSPNAVLSRFRTLMQANARRLSRRD